MSSIFKTFSKRARAEKQAEKQEAKVFKAEIRENLIYQVEHTISLCALAGYHPDKIRRCIFAIPGFKSSLEFTPEYLPNNLLKTFQNIRSRRGPAHTELLETAESAADLLKTADSLFAFKVNDGKAESNLLIKFQESEEFVKRWKEEIRLLHVYECYRLSAKFDAEIRSAAAKLQVKYSESDAEIRADANLAKFDAEASARRADSRTNAAYKNNREVLTPLPTSSRSRSKRVVQQLLTPKSARQEPVRPKGQNGGGVSKPGKAQKCDKDGFFMPRPKSAFSFKQGQTGS